MVHRGGRHRGDRPHHAGRGDHRVHERPEPGSDPVGIAAGPDGNLWFTETSVAKPTVATIGAGAPAAGVSAPQIGGAARVGSPLTCGGDAWSTWAGQQPLRGLFALDGYRWQRDGTALAAEPGPSYTPTADDLGHRVSCQVTVTYPLLSVSASAPSAPVLIGAAPASGGPAPAPIGAGAPILAQAPSTHARRPVVLRRARIAGVARVGRTLRCGGARVRGASAPAYTRRRGGRAIHGARASRYTVRRADLGTLLACAARASGAGGSVTTVSPAVRVRR